MAFRWRSEVSFISVFLMAGVSCRTSVDAGSGIDRAENENNQPALQYPAIKTCPSKSETNDCFIHHLDKLHSLYCLKGKTAAKPWSTTWWSSALGGIAFRYQQDPLSYTDAEGVVMADNWSFSDRYTKATSKKLLWMPNRQRFLDSQNSIQWTPQFLNALSPAEKYDLLIQSREELKNPKWLLTNAVFGDTGSSGVETWFGICHGWAPASLVEPRPGAQAVINIPDPTSPTATIPLTFYSSDIRALTSYYYGRNISRGFGREAASHLLGGRCETSIGDAEENDGSGDNCFDVNPGAWHKSIVNLVPHLGKGAVFDITRDREVWNQPIESYEFCYLSMPEVLAALPALGSGMVDNKKEVGAALYSKLKPLCKNDFSSALVKATTFASKDRYAAKRAPGVQNLVGVLFRNRFGKDYWQLSHIKSKNPPDIFEDEYYLYDLELDADQKILGGEWHVFQHPDFIWYMGLETPAAAGETALAEASALSDVPAAWQEPAQAKVKTESRSTASSSFSGMHRGRAEEGRLTLVAMQCPSRFS